MRGCYFSDIDLKNLLFIMELVHELKGDLILDIFGPIEDKAYWKKCAQIFWTVATTTANKHRLW